MKQTERQCNIIGFVGVKGSCLWFIWNSDLSNWFGLFFWTCTRDGFCKRSLRTAEL